MGLICKTKVFNDSCPVDDTKPANKRTNNVAKSQMVDKKNYWQRRGNRLSRTKQSNRGSFKNRTKRRAGLNRKAKKKQRIGRSRINGNRSKSCKGKRTKSKICRGRTSTRIGRQMKHQTNTRRSSLRKKMNLKCKKRGSKKERKYCRKRKKGMRRGRTLPRTGDE